MATNNSANYATGASGTVLTGQGSGITPIFATFPTAVVFFEAYSSIGQSAVTGNNNIITIQYDTVIANTGAAYDSSTYTFTAPYAGYYFFLATVLGTVLLSTYSINLVITGLNQTFSGANPNSGTNQTFQISSINLLNPGDSVNIQYNVTGAVSNTCGYSGGSGLTTFSGFLIGT